MMRYHEALSRCLEAVGRGEDLESVITRMPGRHRERLRGDASLARALREHSAALPEPAPEAEIAALSRLNAQLDAVRAEREATARRTGFLGVPRIALAGLLLAALLVGAGFLLTSSGDDRTVEAAEFEGVVVANSGESLTVQTLDTLEEVLLPLDAVVVDEEGVKLEPGSIEEGEVVFIRGQRNPRGLIRAVDIRRREAGLPGWCRENADRCRRIADNLREVQSRCRADPETCRAVQDRIAGLVDRISDIADLEDLQQRCQSGGEGCRDIPSFCRDHADLCARDLPPAPVIDRLEQARERLQQLDDLCAGRDTRACRHIAQLCEQHPVLCPDNSPADETPARNQRPAR